MINPLRRLLYEMFVLPVLRPTQKLIDFGSHLARRREPRRRGQLRRWEHHKVLSRIARHLAVLVATALIVPLATHAQQTPPYFPEGSDHGHSSAQQDRSSRRMPPDTSAPEHTKLTTAEVEQQIQNKLDDEPTLDGLSLLASVDGKTVTLRGRVANDDQRNVALRIARSYSGSRKIVDMLKVRDATR
jgi:osmotically-inducible protein OsmY